MVGTRLPEQIVFDASLSTLLRTLSNLTVHPGARARRRRDRIEALTHYVAETVTHHYSRHPSVELPVPEPLFAERVEWLLTAALPWTRHPRHHRTEEPALPTRRPAGPAHDRKATASGACTPSI
ncbi:hypothetical protein ACLGIH_00225 [Streptomyces sp. HMX87]|uniref:hypothetical protein n=1 Tax=Streptomyces sp. HMX87 TaxID=3390849 RepID=UPI003A8C7652